MIDPDVQMGADVVIFDPKLVSNSTIIGGIRIGSHAVIGAGAVVTVDVPDFSIAAGNPARVLRSFTNAHELRQYIESRQEDAS
jgi:serine acetyltransferase